MCTHCFPTYNNIRQLLTSPDDHLSSSLTVYAKSCSMGSLSNFVRKFPDLLVRGEFHSWGFTEYNSSVWHVSENYRSEGIYWLLRWFFTANDRGRKERDVKFNLEGVQMYICEDKYPSTLFTYNLSLPMCCKFQDFPENSIFLRWSWFTYSNVCNWKSVKFIDPLFNTCIFPNFSQKYTVS